MNSSLSLSILGNNVTVIVQSTDSFSDCWSPFFTLFEKYWPECPCNILLNTETKVFSVPGLSVKTTLNSKMIDDKWPTWSESLLIALKQVRTPLVLLILDDFFFSAPVDQIALNTAVNQMLQHGYSSITLTDHGVSRPCLPFLDPFLLAVRQDAKYRISTALSLWKVESLISYLRPGENAWQFEIFGSIRARKQPDSFFVVNPLHTVNGSEGVIPYFHASVNSAIVKGKWQKEICPFLKKNGINIDYSIRGFFSPLPGFLNKYHIIRSVLLNPVTALKGFLGL